MAEFIWIDPNIHWMATLRLQADGSFMAVTVKDTNKITRGRYLTFTSKQDFTSWVQRQASR